MKFIILLYVAIASITTAASNVCHSGIYALLAPLAGYPPAQSYCSAHYPPTTVTVSTSFISKKKFRFARATPAAELEDVVLDKRQQTTTRPHTTTTTPHTTTTTPHTTTTTPHTTTTTQDPKAAQWSSFVKTAGSIISTFCQCIESHPTVGVPPPSTIPTTTPSTTTPV
ncbi:hypothetical protein AYL99_02762 [Fonsecaea erecta]|uniref:Uncharacterized protein n=1 Tax=Fonsecaea erecta TaxID=1367422 RepID=A0A178ZX19_9EURO|nr:hypothetical protein AYL99_02762 [Fonsecaea erecta]OAP63535.1 hypothetical protein AYL99_02762 [Fonsecaea erecta]